MVNVAIYTRLSHEDADSIESESIQNQKAMLSDYCRERNWNIYDIYCDEDYSGIDRSRPDFSRMLTDCEHGQIDIVLCKSQSRFSRDMEVIEKYIHNKFLEWNVRFISIVDRADSHDIANKKARQINGLINEWYLEDTSENIRKTLDNKRKRGEFTGSFAPFGYIVNPKNKNHLLIDSYAANIVRNIFDWYLQGWGYRKIVMQLNQSAIPCPTLYKQNQNSRYVNPNSQTASKGLWTQSTIYNIIRNENYTGTLVQGKSHFVSYKNRKKIKVPKDDWVRVPDCHEAIIDPQIWTKTQDKLAGKNRVCRTTQEVSPLSGLVKCAVCGKPMKRNVYYNKARTIQYYNLTCGTYKVGAMNCQNAASISGLQLESALVAQINSWIADYCNLDKIEIKSEHDLKIARLNIDLEMLQSAINKIDTKSANLYEDKIEGVITKEQFVAFSKKFEKEAADLKSKQKSIEQQIEAVKEMSVDSSHREKLVQKYAKIDKLTRLVAEEFIESVLIGEKFDGQEREITVNWKL
jgi:DNA invertase Pin-like site-specific DNA recombinase/uncharacterized LabA/DUF88 family protein